jgi:hypothetical protein
VTDPALDEEPFVRQAFLSAAKFLAQQEVDVRTRATIVAAPLAKTRLDP